MPPYPFDDPALGRVAERTGDGGRLGRDDAVALFATRDLWGLARLANRERERHHGDRTFYTVSRHLNYSNLCVNRCRFCAFRRDRGQDDAWEYSVAEALERLRAKTPQDVAELHVVGGLHPDRPLEFYLNLLDELRRQYPEAQIKAFTAPEIAHIARRAGLSVAETLQRLISVGLDCLPGGGAEIFAPQVRRRICPEKITGAE